MTVALVTTVRDERELLRANLLYHHYLGVETAFVYSDGSTDGTLASVESLPFVQAGPSLGAERIAGRPEFARAAAHVGSHTTARQIINTWDAMERARAAGCTWLLSLDADELACAHPNRAESGAIAALLETVPAQVQCLRFPTMEIVQRGIDYANVFAQETLFKREGTRIRRRVRDPLRRRTVTVRGFYGHTAGKSALRLAADAVPRTPHRFTARDGSALVTVTTGALLHYYCYNAASFVAKFRRFSDHPDVHLWQAPTEPTKRLWRDVVNHAGLSVAEIDAYYRRWVAFDERRVRQLRRSTWLGIIPRRSAVVEVTGPQRVFAALAQVPASGGA